MIRRARQSNATNRNDRRPRRSHRRWTAAVLALAALLTASAANAQSTAGWLKAEGSPSSTGDYALTWAAVPARYGQFTLFECAGTASACRSESDYTAIAAPSGVRRHDVPGKAEGRYTYRLQACYGSGRLRPRICNSSGTVTVVVSYLAGTEAEKANATGGMPYGTGVTKRDYAHLTQAEGLRHSAQPRGGVRSAIHGLSSCSWSSQAKRSSVLRAKP